MDFQPINSDHAVQSAAFAVAFDGTISPAAIQELKTRKDLLGELPAVQAPEAFEVNLNAGAAPGARRFVGVQLSHLRPDGTPAWALRMMGNELVVECTRYTRWDKVWEAASRYLGAGLEASISKDSRRKAAAISQAVVDVFVSNQDSYRLEDLLRPNNLVSAQVFAAGPTWHSHVGWFSTKEGASPTWLNQLRTPANLTAPISG